MLIEGRLLEAILKAEQGMASRDAARNRSPGRRTAPPAGQYDPAARSSLHGLRRIMPQTEARPTATNRHGGAPKGARPASWDAGRLANAANSESSELADQMFFLRAAKISQYPNHLAVRY